MLRILIPTLVTAALFGHLGHRHPYGRSAMAEHGGRLGGVPVEPAPDPPLPVGAAAGPAGGGGDSPRRRESCTAQRLCRCSAEGSALIILSLSPHACTHTLSHCFPLSK